MSNFRTAAIVCEYNPFHNGHQYHIEQTRAICGADFIVAIMSGNFVQRGEPAILDKWTRAEMALRCGADLVVELPAPYALSSAQYFAAGAAALADRMSVITHLSFGSESFGGTDGLARLERFVRRTPQGPVLDAAYLKQGRSYAAAAASASHVTAPNDVLGAEYVRALRRISSEIRPVAVKRTGCGHDRAGSAMEIRKLLRESEPAGCWKGLMPVPAAELLERELSRGGAPVFSECLTQAVFAALRSLGREGLCNCPSVGEGLDYKIYSAACACADFETLIRSCTSLRYTSSRIRRIVFSALLGITGDLVKTVPPYIRVLGMRRDCGALMDALTASARIPVITSKARFLKTAAASERTAAEPFLRVENRAADLYALARPALELRSGCSELTHPLVFV